jgi:hypothetical protein
MMIHDINLFRENNKITNLSFVDINNLIIRDLYEAVESEEDCMRTESKRLEAALLIQVQSKRLEAALLIQVQSKRLEAALLIQVQSKRL